MNYFANICRICMSRDIELINIYHTDDDMLTYIDKLNTCVPEIFTADNYIPLPDQICDLCCKNLKIVFWFRELCLKSNSLLRSYKLQLENCTQNTCKQGSQLLLSINDTPKELKSVELTVKDHVSENTRSSSSKELNETTKTQDDIVDIKKDGDIVLPLAIQILSDEESSKMKSEDGSDNECANENDNSNSFLQLSMPSPDIIEHKIDINESVEQESVQTETNSEETSQQTLNKGDSSNSQSVCEEQEPVSNTVTKQSPSESQPKAASQDGSQLKKMRHLCSFCGKPFKYRQDMRIHERIHTGYKPYVCSVCSKPFAKSTRLKLHMNTHTREKTFPCPICNKLFNQNSNLSMHMKLHTQTERFACHLCEKTFSQKRHLKQHILFHEDEKRYTCEICNWNFTMKHHLKRHMLTHSGQKPPKKELPKDRERKFPCTECEWSFMSKEVLKRHMQMHTRENARVRTSLNDEKRRFPCPFCVWSFTKKHHLERHMTKHEENRTFSCSVCNEEFKKNYELKRHMKTHDADMRGNQELVEPC